MSDTNSPTPKPNISNKPPATPPTTSADMEESKAPEVKKEEVAASEPSAVANGVEADFMKRFLGVFIDGIVAFVIASVVGGITGSSILYTAVWAVVMLTRDSLPFLDGQSIGKKLMKTKAVKEDGSSLSGDWATGATRNILFLIPVGGLIEGIVLLTRSGKPDAGLRLGDGWAKTKVVSSE